MTAGVPGVLISRDGTVREYVGHSNRSGAILGIVRRQGKGNVWQAVCAGCKVNWYRSGRNDVVWVLRDHWDTADSQIADAHRRDGARS